MAGRPKRNYFFTINNPSEACLLVVFDIDEMKRLKFIGLCAQTEVGESGTKHIQGYAELASPQRISYLRKFLHTQGIHCEVPRNREAAIAYCKKDKSYDKVNRCCWGTCLAPKGQGRRSDLAQATDLVRNNAHIRDIALAHPETFVRYHRGLTALGLVLQQPRTSCTELIILWGDSGTGKSRACPLPPEAHWVRRPQSNGTLWWDGYANHQSVVFDDFYGWVPYSFLLNICDRYPLTVDTKGGCLNFNSQQVWITSNKPPSGWYKFPTASLRRRITSCTHYCTLEKKLTETMCSVPECTGGSHKWCDEVPSNTRGTLEQD